MNEYTFANPEYESKAGAIIYIYRERLFHKLNWIPNFGPTGPKVVATDARIYFEPCDWISRDIAGELFATWF